MDAVEKELRRYADRGVFRSFDAKDERAGKRRFTMAWLGPRSQELVYDAKRRTLTFPALLPNLPARSSMYREFREFLQSRSDETLPAHRRIDPDRSNAVCTNRKGSVSVAVECLDGDLSYSTKKAISLVNEIFLGFLRGPYHEYTAANFDEPEE